MFLDLLEPRVKNQNLSLAKKIVSVIWSQILERKKATCPLKTLKKIICKNVPKTGNCPQSWADSKASTINPIKYLRLLFISKFFITVFFVIRHRRPRNMMKLDLNI